MTSKERLYAVIQGRPHDRPAVTPIFMSWAAHYINRSYRDYYLDGDVLVGAQLAVTKAFGIDQASAISDPWREASGFGMEFDYPEEGVGKPRAYLITSEADLGKLRPVDAAASGRMGQRVESVGKLAAAVGRTHSVLGWVEGPLAEYADLRGVEYAMLDLIDAPKLYLAAAEIVVENAIAFARAQISAGADMIGIGDAAASLIGPVLYRDLVLPLETRLVAAIHDSGAAVKLHICGNTGPIVGIMARTGADIIDLDWMVPLEKAREAVGPGVTLCGNFDPVGVLLQGTPESVAAFVRDCLRRGGSRFILMPGCEVPPATPEANIRAFCPGDGGLIREIRKP
ncbi:MAG: uroporphyrinogen decarboxylase family protein [Candidatus Aminicenantales bacterium]